MKYDAIWVDRKFEFNLPGELYPMQVERLRGTLIRLEDKIKNLNDEQFLKRRESWSIREQIGHLVKVEKLWHLRNENFRKKEKNLFAPTSNRRPRIKVEGASR